MDTTCLAVTAAGTGIKAHDKNVAAKKLARQQADEAARYADETEGYNKQIMALQQNYNLQNGLIGQNIMTPLKNRPQTIDTSASYAVNMPVKQNSSYIVPLAMTAGIGVLFFIASRR